MSRPYTPPPPPRARLWMEPLGVAVSMGWPLPLERLQQRLGLRCEWVPMHWVLPAPPEAQEALLARARDELVAEGFVVIEEPPAPAEPPKLAPVWREMTLEEQVTDALEERRATGRW